ncbi:related to aminotriazole resistance protein [Fusarium fujikuroi]|nr:related to aminotriazole resistance protein [Fusarium fujikuroi]
MASLGSVVGSLLGGFVGSTLGWKWVFWIPAIASAFTTAAGWFVTASHTTRIAPRGITENAESSKKPYVDWIGGGLVSSSLTLLLVAITQGNVSGWSTPWIPPLLVVSVSLLGGFIFYQRRLEIDPDRIPLMRMSMFAKKQFSALFVLVGCFYASFNGFLVFVTYFYQKYQGLGELQTTLRFLPAGISGLLISFAVFPALNHLPYFIVLVVGLSCSVVSPSLFAIPSIPPTTTYWAWGFPAMCLCMSVEIVWPVFSLLTAKSLAQEDQSLGGGLLQTVNNVGRALGLAIATAIQTAVAGDINNEQGSNIYLDGLRAAQWFNFTLAVTGILLALVFFRGLDRS